MQSLQRTVTPARCIFLDGLTFNLKHVGQSHGAACCMILFTKYPRYLELGVENMDFRAVKWWQAPIDAAPSSSCPCECQSFTPHTLPSVPLCRPYTGPTAAEDIWANISNCCCCSLCLWSRPENGFITNVIYPWVNIGCCETARPFFSIIFAIFTRTLQQRGSIISSI